MKSKKKKTSSRVLTRIADSVSNDDNQYAKHAP